MDSKSASALVCAGIGPVGDVILQQYVVDVRERVGKTNLPLRRVLMWPSWRCHRMEGSGRCRKRVSKAAVLQLCAKHQCARGLMSLGNTDSFVDRHLEYLRDRPSVRELLKRHETQKC